MPVRIAPATEAERDARRQLASLARELRIARLTNGLSQAEVARRVGTSRTWVSRAERGTSRAISLAALVQHAAAVGLQLRVRAHPLRHVPLDAGQLAVLGRLRARLPPAAWGWQLEVPMPLPGDLRAADALLTSPAGTVLIEAETRLVDLQAQLRRAQVKRRELHADRLVLLVADSRANRRVLRESSDILQAAFGVAPRTALKALAAGQLPATDALLAL
jgi:transcriptional regulator with XRE-family HTH domain